MAWNEPGRGKDPWGNGNGRGRGPSGGAPDLDELLRRLQRRFSSLFGGGSGGQGNGATIALILVLLGGAWLLSGFYQVDAAEKGVVLRFGELSEVTPPGLHWHLPWPLERVETVNVSEIAQYPYKTLMLTRDENIVSVDLTVQYRRADPEAFLFNVRRPEETLADVTQSVIREVVGKNTMDFVLGEGRAEIAARTMELAQATLNNYQAGIEITSVNLQDANFPGPVQPAVRDAIKAREDKERLELEAQSYANDILPRARGEAARRLEAAQAYKQETIANAEGQTARFVALLKEYAKAPRVTRERLYLDTMESVLGATSKVIVTAEGSGNLMYLPLDKLLEQRAGGTAASGASTVPGMMSPDASSRARESARSREDRR